MLNIRALCYGKLERNQEALQDFNRCIQLNPKQGTFYQNRSFQFNKMGDKKSALKDIQKAQQLGVNVNPQYVESLKKE